MSDHADIVGDVLGDYFGPFPTPRSNDEVRAALAALDALVAERDRLLERAYAMTEKRDAQMLRAEAAEARVAALTEALERIAEAKPLWSQQGKHWVPHAHRLQSIARAALAAGEET